MIAVLTGDIINSRALPEEWINTLKSALEGLFGKNVKWEIFRGDSFQVELNAKDALLNAIYIKACIKTLKKADVRIGIGIGKKSISAEKVSEANGEVFINSGSAFDALKLSKVNMAIKTPWPKYDEDINLSIRLALIAMDSWGQISAEMVKYAIENQNTNQDKIAKISGRSQSSVSEALKRAHFTEIMELESKYSNQISKLIKK
ncbi:transcriptional regulator [Pedobacter sp. LMG 31464]|uniref:Transcriptional regulator n=1 Tax=Pedobacter planticolens TaxID=2679964 RepID=A0A923DW00_9SPHI|nr:transcriptional regulator [Pedobacter planticolens]MBB2144996.1 transcriptional regulator [Pedobacter planticolens]